MTEPARSETTSAREPRDTKNARAKRTFAAFVAAHMLAYPIAAVWAAGAVVPILARMPPRELATATQADAVRHVLGALLWPSIALFVGLHLTAIPWMRDAQGTRGVKVTLGLNALALALGLVFAAAAWGWLFTR